MRFIHTPVDSEDQKLNAVKKLLKVDFLKLKELVVSAYDDLNPAKDWKDVSIPPFESIAGGCPRIQVIAHYTLLSKDSGGHTFDDTEAAKCLSTPHFHQVYQGEYVVGIWMNRLAFDICIPITW